MILRIGKHKHRGLFIENNVNIWQISNMNNRDSVKNPILIPIKIEFRIRPIAPIHCVYNYELLLKDVDAWKSKQIGFSF